MKSAFFRISFLCLAVVAAISLCAAPVDLKTAQARASSYLTNQVYAGKLMAASATTPTLLKTEVGSKLAEPVYYIFNTSTSYVVVAGDDRAEEILVYGDRPLRDVNNLPLGLKDMLKQYKTEIEYLQEHPGLEVERVPSPQTAPTLKATTVAPMLTALWDQEEPYWDQCVFTYNGRSYQCLTGCPATSASMVMYYWKYPTTQVPAMSSYTSTLDLSYYSSVNFTYPSLPATTFDWANMIDDYTSGYTTAQGAAVATLMRYVGQAEEMMYGTEAAGGSGIYVSANQMIADMFIHFGYKSTAKNVQKTGYTDTQWAELIQSELAAGRPLVFCAVDTYNGGHAFNVDGYNANTNKYHVNFGWSGEGNAYCALNSFGTSGYTFNSSQQMIVGVEPPDGGGTVTTATITVSPASLSFETTAGNTVTKTFTVTGSNLTGNVTLAKSGNSAFTFTPSTITAAEAAAGKTVTVTYSPTATGTHTGTITASSAGASSVSVSLQGTAVAPTITVSPSSLTMSAGVGGTVTKTFTVTGTNLTGALSLALSDVNGVFAINRTSITSTAAASGVTVTVTYSPTTAGTHAGTVTVSGGGATAQTVSLTGTAVEPEIVVSPATLSLTAEAGESVTKTFTVTGYDLTGPLSLSLNGGNGTFSVSPTTISAASAAFGATVTVTYAPSAVGANTATVTISGGGAQSKTVSLNGTATVPTPVAAPSVSSLTLNAFAGASATTQFTVTGKNLTGNLTLALDDANGVFAVSPATISAQDVLNGATVTVTYSPLTFGAHSATLTIAGGGVEDMMVTLNGVAALETFAPVMSPVDENYLTLTSFRADWTDRTLASNVASYTLEVSEKPDVLELCNVDFAGVTKKMTGSVFTNMVGSYADYLPEGWTAAGNFYVYNDYVIPYSTSKVTSTISTPECDLAGYGKVTVVIDATCYMASYYTAGAQLTVATSKASQTLTVKGSGTSTYTIVLDCADTDQVTFTGVKNYFGINSITVFAGDQTAQTLNATEAGDQLYRLVEGITPDKFYTVRNLAAGGTFRYKVKALYIDGTESAWSNSMEVTLAGDGHAFELGDVNHDEKIDVSDVTALIAYILGADSGICAICANVNGDSNIDVSDVTALISVILGNN